MTKHKHADLIHAWADGAEIQTNDIGEWRDVVEATYIFNPHFEYRIKPKEPEWWENIPERGVLCWVNDYDPDPNIGLINVVIKVESGNYRRFVDVNDCRWDYAIPLTNEEIKQFLRGE